MSENIYKNEPLETAAGEYANKHQFTCYGASVESYKAGFNSRNEEVAALKKEIASMKAAVLHNDKIRNERHSECPYCGSKKIAQVNGNGFCNHCKTIF